MPPRIGGSFLHASPVWNRPATAANRHHYAAMAWPACRTVIAGAKVTAMSFGTRVAAALAALRESVPNDAGQLPGIMPPSRAAAAGVNAEDAASLSTVYRALQVMATAASQISYHLERGGKRVAAASVPSLLKLPCLDMSRSDFVEQTVLSLLTAGNAYWLKNLGPDGAILDLTPLNPHDVRPAKDPQSGRIVYHFAGKQYGKDRMVHLAVMKLPGRLTGLGPIQAAQIELRGALELRDYAALWFSEGKIPSGILTTDQALDAATAKQWREAWNGTDTNPVDNPSGVRVLGKGATYEPLMLKPADAQWLESQQFTTTQLARLFGAPASLMLAAVEGSAMTYSNVEQDWIAFVRFTLAGYLRKIEEALTDLTARGQEVRFNYEALLRTDTKTRYEAHQIALNAGFMTPDEVRAIEGLEPFTDDQLDELAARRASKAAAAAPAPDTEQDVAA